MENEIVKYCAANKTVYCRYIPRKSFSLVQPVIHFDIAFMEFSKIFTLYEALGY